MKPTRYELCLSIEVTHKAEPERFFGSLASDLLRVVAREFEHAAFAWHNFPAEIRDGSTPFSIR
jgi:hypothetical protein